MLICLIKATRFGSSLLKCNVVTLRTYHFMPGKTTLVNLLYVIQIYFQIEIQIVIWMAENQQGLFNTAYCIVSPGYISKCVIMKSFYL